MVTHRQSQASAPGGHPANAAAGEVGQALDPDAPRTFRALRVPFNEYEWTQLDEGARRTGRSKLNLLRRAMLEYLGARESDAG